MGRRLRVLVADDHETYRRLLADLFGALGCVVTTVNDGEEALAAPGPFDIVCLDRHMGGLDGQDVAAKLLGSAYLVACTSDPDGLGPGFDAVLPKPVCCCELTAIVADARARSGRQRRAATSSTPCAAASAVANVACNR